MVKQTQNEQNDRENNRAETLANWFTFMIGFPYLY